MLTTVFHVGVDHPSVLWVLVPSLLSFLAGLGLGVRFGRVRELLGPGSPEATD